MLRVAGLAEGDAAFRTIFGTYLGENIFLRGLAAKILRDSKVLT